MKDEKKMQLNQKDYGVKKSVELWTYPVTDVILSFSGCMVTWVAGAGATVPCSPEGSEVNINWVDILWGSGGRDRSPWKQFFLNQPIEKNAERFGQKKFY